MDEELNRTGRKVILSGLDQRLNQMARGFFERVVSCEEMRYNI